MRISKKAEYALRALVTIARQQKSWRIEELSVRENIPIKYLEQILLALRHAGILTSKRGVGGGYALLRPASKISVGEIIRILDGPLAPVPCAASGSTERCSCPDPRTCAVRIVMLLSSWVRGCESRKSTMPATIENGLRFRESALVCANFRLSDLFLRCFPAFFPPLRPLPGHLPTLTPATPLIRAWVTRHAPAQ